MKESKNRNGIPRENLTETGDDFCWFDRKKYYGK